MLRLSVPLSILAGCAHATFEPRIVPAHGGPSAPLTAAAEEATRTKLSQVRVTYELPPGVRVEGSTLAVEAERYTLAGEVMTELDLSMDSLVSFYRYDVEERWKNKFCNAQVPLVWATLGLWTLAPARWPCLVAEGRTPQAIDRRHERIVEALVRGTIALKANLLVVAQVGDVRTILVTQTGRIVGASNVPTAYGRGFALRDTAR